MQITRWLVFIIFIGSFQWYAFQAFRTISNLKVYSFIYWFLSSLIIANFVYQTLSLDRTIGFNYNFSISLGYFLALLLFDFIAAIEESCGKKAKKNLLPVGSCLNVGIKLIHNVYSGKPP